jgi:hypothetical protein
MNVIQKEPQKKRKTNQLHELSTEHAEAAVEPTAVKNETIQWVVDQYYRNQGLPSSVKR